MNRSEQRGLLASLIAGSTLRGGTPVDYDKAQGIVSSLERRLLETGCAVLVMTADDKRKAVELVYEKIEVLGGDDEDVK
jgi:hypothetical protein